MNQIQNDRLTVTFRYDPEKLFSTRFESIGVMEQICLDGKYNFCEPEQRIAERMTCNGVGLCGDYVWNELGEEAAPGEKFPKLGVGLMIQRPEAGPYGMFKKYEAEVFPTHAEFGPDWAKFVQEPIPCNGIAARITKLITLEGNEIHVKTTMENCGERVLDLNEYQHNFLSLNGRQPGPGYVLDVPFDGDMERIKGLTNPVSRFRDKISGYMNVKDGKIIWEKVMDGVGFHKVTMKEDLHPENGAYWKLSHEEMPISVMEKINFEPTRLVMWGVEHCICAEVYVGIHVLPGEEQTWERVWKFSDEKDGR